MIDKANGLEENTEWIGPPIDYTLYAPLDKNVPFWYLINSDRK